MIDPDHYDWYGMLPRWSRWWKYGWAREFRTNFRRAVKFRSMMEFRHYRYWWYRRHHRS